MTRPAEGRRGFTVAAATAIASVIAFLVFVSMVSWQEEGDFALHMLRAKQAGVSVNLFTYSLYFPLQHLLSLGSRSQGTMEAATIVIATVFVAMRVWVAGWYGRSEGLAEPVAATIALAVTFSMPVFDPRGLVNSTRLEDIYLGQISPNVWHNATTIMMVPFAVAALIVGVRWIEQPNQRSLWHLGLLTFVCTLMKPNFTIVLIPTLAVLAGAAIVRAKHRRDATVRLAQLALAMAPAVILLFVERLLTLSRENPTQPYVSFIVEPFSQWSRFTDSIPLSVARSLLLPVVLTLLLWRKREIDLLITASWLVLAFSVLMFAVLSEADRSGTEIFAGDWGWAVIPSAFALFLSTIVTYYRLQSGGVTSGGSGTIQWTWECRLVTALIGLYVVAGAFYLVGISTGAFSYGIL